jgi:DNA-binding Lrp family transcriptional regulator
MVQFLCGYVYIYLILLNKRQVNQLGVRILGLKLKGGPTKKLDAIDLQIIRALEEDSRVSLRKLAQRVGVTPNVLHNRLESLEDEGIILGYVPVVDSAKMGYALTAIIMIQVEGGHIIEVENEIAKESNVLSVYDITGEYDAIVFAKFRDNSSLNGYLKKLLTERFIKRTTTLIALNAVKEYSKVI